MDRDNKCLACNGKGFSFNENKGYEEECLACNGTGTEYSTPEQNCVLRNGGKLCVLME